MFAEAVSSLKQCTNVQDQLPENARDQWADGRFRNHRITAYFGDTDDSMSDLGDD